MRENKKLQTIVIISGIALFFGILLVYYLARLGVFAEDTKKTKVLNNRVTFEQPKLSVFDETRYINVFPDTIHIHYPYLMVVVPEDTKQITTIYSLEEKKQIVIFHDILLDYSNKNFLYNYHGGNTFFNNKNLKLHCDQGFIKSNIEILCIVPKASDPMDNKLISINPQTLASKDVYSSQNALTAVYYDKSTLYIGEYNYTQQKAYITVNNITAATDNLVNVIYPMQNNIYVASFKSIHNNNTESYYEITTSNKKLDVKLIERKKISFL